MQNDDYAADDDGIDNNHINEVGHIVVKFSSVFPEHIQFN